MAIYRGTGDATGNAAISEIENLRSDAQLAASSAEEWANKAEDSLVSTAAGGDGVDDYSALHWSIKAEDQKIAAEAAKTAAETAQTGAETAETNAQTAQTAAELAETNAETARAGAETAEDGAIAAAATVPAYETLTGNALLYTRLNTNEDTMEFRTATETTQDLGVEVGVDVQPFDATILNDADIGVTVQGYDVNTAKYNDATANFTGTLQEGGVDVATTAEIPTQDQSTWNTGTDTTESRISSLKLDTKILDQFNATGVAPLYACRAWVNFVGTGTVAILGSGNVSSITDTGTGNYTINLTTALPDINYAPISGSVESAAQGTTDFLINSTSDFRIRTYGGGTLADFPNVFVAVFR